LNHNYKLGFIFKTALLVYHYLKIIFVSEDTAERDACTLEHNLSSESVTQLTKFIDFIESRPILPQWLEHFKTFCKTGGYECKKIKE